LRTLAARAVVVAGAYLATALAVFAAVVVLRGIVSPDRLRDLLAFYFIAALAAGLEPATVKACVLAGARAPGNLAAILAAGAVKGVMVAPVLALVWRFADPAAAPALLWLSPLTAVAGFWATDLRVLLDLRGRHAGAVWLKQGSLAGGFLLLAILVGLGAPLVLAALVSTLARLAPPILIARRFHLGDGATVIQLLSGRRWLELAAISAVAAAGGSIDRVLALRFLPATAFAGYTLVYELFTRFWLIPYLVTPILFARLAAGEASHDTVSRAWAATAALGAAFVAASIAVAVWAPALAGRVLGAPFGAAEVAFAVAVVTGAFTQLRIAQLQAVGAVRPALAVTAIGAAVSAIAFFIGVRTAGLSGLLWAWSIKSLIELAAALAVGDSSNRVCPRPVR
jgi:hypothetical protein